MTSDFPCNGFRTLKAIQTSQNTGTFVCLNLHEAHRLIVKEMEHIGNHLV